MPPLDTAAERDKSDASGAPCAHCDMGEQAFCHGLSPEDVRRLVAILGTAGVVAGTTIFREGDPALNLYSISAGAVKLYKLLSDGRRQITAFLFPGDYFGLSLQGGYAYTAEAMADTSLCRFPRRKLDLLLDEIPKLEKRLLGATIHELTCAQDQMLLLGRKTAREKVASFLAGLWQRLCAKAGTSQIFLPMSRSDIADYLGLTIETVSRTLTSFKKEGLVSLPDASHVVIRDRETLVRIAEGG